MENQNYYVSVFVVTYNQQDYIAQCIESILIQKTNFSYEIVIGEDKSTDNTLQICKQYAEKNKNIKIIESTTNIGLISNWIRTLNACSGKYIAMCEGDDFWINSDKLQIQYDFLENNMDYSMCFTNTLLRFENTGEETVAKKNIWDTETTSSLLRHNDFIEDDYILPGHTSAIMFRNNLITKYPTWLKNAEVCDLPLFLMLSKYGKAKFININTSIYRQHALNLSSNNFSFLTLYLNRIFIYKNINVYLNFEFKDQINGLLAKYYVRITKIYFCNKNYLNALKFAMYIIRYDKRYLLKTLNYMIKYLTK